ncbi:uncharacterized protein LOC116350289, partial [Contarinia nasturtii]|uniref:uncharacterized protein LOC116350289 n=1 Tax=Contarinia nasturtii TaxID=265458 RepID=UPI0012D3FF09
MEPEFRQFAQNLDDDHRFEWPNNKHFGNAMGDIIDIYENNLITNLNTHPGKRLREYLNMKVYKINSNPYSVFKFQEKDVSACIRLAIFGNDVVIRGMDDVAKRERVQWLMDYIRRICWWDIPNDNLGLFTKKQWFKSLQIWLTMQREIDEFNIDQELREERKEQRQEQRKQRRQKRKQDGQQQSKSPENNAKNNVPKIKNLTVIPICQFKRKYFPIDTFTLYKILCGLKLMPKNDNGIQLTSKEFQRDKEWYWDKIFDMPKIKRLGKRKKMFHYRIMSDGEGVSLLYDIEREPFKPTDKAAIRKRFVENGPDKIKKLLGIDPNEKTWNATVQRDVETGKEVNIKISSKHYHWIAEQKVRNKKAKRYTKSFTQEEQNDRNNRALYPVMPSPMGKHWLCYVHHRLKMLDKGMEAYASDKYTRLCFDKYVESNSAIDQITGMLVNYEAAVVYFGAAEISPNLPFHIKKHVRCPGARKMKNAFKKRGDCVIVPTDEYYKSQTCPKCLERFDPRTKSHRFKVCQDCKPHPAAMLPSMIVTQMGTRKLQTFRKIDRIANAEAEANHQNAGPLLSKVVVYRKIWLVNPDSGVLEYADTDAAQQQPSAAEQLNALVAAIEVEFIDFEGRIKRKTVWHRDIAAAKCILIKGKFEMEDVKQSEVDKAGSWIFDR